MKNSINIWNPNKGNEIVTLDELREKIAERRYLKLSGAGLAKCAQHKVSVLDKKDTNQPATSYASFEIRNFTTQKAIDVFNAGGCQVASIITK